MIQQKVKADRFRMYELDLKTLLSYFFFALANFNEHMYPRHFFTYFS